MRHVVALTLLAAVLLAVVPAEASGGHGGGEGKAADKADKSNAVDMPPLVAPMVVDERLTGYAYINSTLEATSSSAAIAIRAKTPFLQDAFIRDVNATPVVQAGAPDKLDEAGVKARLLADARRVMGPGKVKSIAFAQVQISPFAPKQ